MLDLAVDGEGTVWVAANLLGLLRLRPDGPWRPELPDRGVFSVDVDAEGRIWAAAFDTVHVRDGAASGWREHRQEELNYVRWGRPAPTDGSTCRPRRACGGVSGGSGSAVPTHTLPCPTWRPKRR